MIAAVLTLVLVAATTAQNSTTSEPAPVEFGLTECPPGVCECAPPNEFPGNVVTFQNGTTNCLCSCGINVGGLCDDTKSCCKGTACTAPADMATHPDKHKGVCSDRCQYVSCPQYHSCLIQDGEAMCVCRKYDCIDSVDVPVKAVRGSEIRVFPNRCMMVNTNCEELLKDPTTARWMVSQD